MDSTSQLLKQSAFTFVVYEKIHLDPQLFLNGIPIPIVEKTKFLGLIFDRKLSFIPRLRYLKEKCLKAINCCTQQLLSLPGVSFNDQMSMTRSRFSPGMKAFYLCESRNEKGRESRAPGNRSPGMETLFITPSS